MSYKKGKIRNNRLTVNKSVDGEPIELKIERMLEGKEPMTNGTNPPIYQDRGEGVNPATDIRTDRWGVAAMASDKMAKSQQAQRQNLNKGKKENKDGKAEPTEGTTETKKG